MLKFPQLWMENVSLGEKIANELRLRILENDIKQGEVLSENKIARHYGTSRSPVRDALKALAYDGLIRLERMGAVVLGLNPEDIQELYDVREIIENFAQQRASDRNLKELTPLLLQEIDKMEVAAKYNNHSDFAYHDLTFHETIIRYAEHKRILNLWNSMRPLIMAVILMTTEEVFSHDAEHIEFVINKHRILVQGLQSKNEETIKKSVGQYFNDSKHTLIKTFPSP